uniref:hypothetical protein n=1 Tax=Orrella sp. TaxID=1921583 RepID=UPI004048C726
MSNNQNQPTAQTLGNPKELYPQKLLSARTTALFVTIPQTKINYQELHNKILTKKNINYLLTKLEQHKDEGLHIHIIVKSNQAFRISAIHNIIMSFKEDRTGNSTIDYQKPDNIQASINYLKKEETSIIDQPFLEWGEAPRPAHRPKKNIQEEDIFNALELAQDGQADEALQQIRQSNPRDYLLYKNQIRETLQSEKKPLKKWDLPEYNTDETKLTKSQQKLWDLLQRPPKARQIFWITGDYGSGKTFIKNYIENNYEYGTYDAGQSASLDNVAYAYNEEGAIMWDLPRTFNFAEMGDAIANVIEKFSDYGTKISSKKYNGKTQRVRGHTIVFSNQPCLQQLEHRDIVKIHMIKDNEDEEETHLVHSNEEYITYAPNRNESIRPVISNNSVLSESEEEEDEVIIEETTNPNIQRITRGSIYKYKTNYKTKPEGKTYTKVLDTFNEAEQFIKRMTQEKK